MNPRILVSLLVLLCSTVVSALEDGRAWDWRTGHDLPLHWDNVEDSSARWVAGVEPRYDTGSKLHLVELGTGDHSLVQVAAGQWLQLVAVDGNLRMGDLRLTRSVDGRLFAPEPVREGRDPGVLVTSRLHAKTGWVRIEPSADNVSPVRLALFVSRLPSAGKITLYPHELAIGQGAVAVRLSDRPGQQTYWQLQPNRDAALQVKGPQRIELRSRLILDAHTSVSDEAYRITASLDGGEQQFVELETTGERRTPVQLDSCVSPVGRIQTGYIDIPGGVHQLSLRASRAVYLQLSASRGGDDFLFEGNEAALPIGRKSVVEGASIWSVPVPALQQQLARASRVPETEWLAQRLARDNRWRAANLSAARELAGPPDYSAGALLRFKLAKRRAALLQRYSGLLPNFVPGSYRQRTLQYQRVSLAEREDPELIWTRQLRALAENVASGEFVHTPPDSRQALTYRLPERDHDTVLRLALIAPPGTAKEAVYIQFDDAPGQAVLLEDPLPSSRAAVFRPDRATLANAVLAESEMHRHSGSVRLPWGEIQVPAAVRSVRIWASQRDTWTALQLQKPVVYAPGEAAYVSAVESVGQAAALERFIDSLQTNTQGDFSDSDVSRTAAEAELNNLWLPLLRFLHVQARYFSTGADTGPEDNREDQVDPKMTAYYRDRAQQAGKAGDHVLAIEYWSRALRGLAGKSRDAVRLRRARALQAAGEVTLAKRDLWGVFRTSNNPDVQNDALERLLDVAGDRGDAEHAVRVLSAALLVRPAPELLERLLPSLVEAGRSSEAVQVALLLPITPAVAESLLLASRSESWWMVFERARMSLPDGEEKRFWSAWPYIAAGDYARAVELWAESGDAGLAASTRLQQARLINRAFSSPGKDERYQALLAWEQWQADFMEDTVWYPATESVRAYAGSATVTIPELGIDARGYLGTPSHGITLDVYGPTRLRVALRPLYPEAQVQPADDWLVVRLDGRPQYHAVSDNAPDPERHILENGLLKVGQRNRFVVDIPPGYHQLKLALRDHDAVFDLELERPALFSGVLPDLTPRTAALLLTGAVNHDAVPATGIDWPVRLAKQCEFKSLAVSIPALNAGNEPDTSLFTVLSKLRDTSAASGPDDPVQELASLLWQAEQDPSRLEEISARFHELYTTMPADAETRALMRRLQRKMSWKPLTNLWQRAGVRDVTLPTAAGPEHPPARIRHALLPELEEQEQRISGRNALVFSLEQPHEVDFAFDFTLEGLLDNPVAEIEVAVTIDSGPERILGLGPQRPRTRFHRTIGAGAHSVRVRLLDPVARHSVRVRVSERKKDNGWLLHALRPALRSYDIATDVEPLVLHTRGPAVLRIDEWRGDHIAYRYQTVRSGWQKLSFKAPAGQEEALYRVFQWVADKQRPALPAQLPASALADVPAAPRSRAYESGQAPALLNQLPLEGQEDGTLSATLDLASRRNLDEDRDVNTDAERFFELRGTHRKYLRHWQGYHRFDALTRIRQDGGPTLGLREFLSIPTGWRDVELDFNGSFYTQRPGGEAGTEWLGDLRARIIQRRDLSARSYHRPSLSLFRRWMSMNNDLDKNPERVDQDVFTSYKEQHQQGLAIGDDFFYRPWGDTVTWLGVNATSNDDFNVIDPDHVRGRVGARVLWRDWDFGAEYAATRYFEDDDRNNGETRQRVRLEAQLWRWNSPRDGLQLRFRLDHDRSSNDNSAWLSLTWHRSNGRFFRDFRPGDLNFRGLRERISNERLFGKDPGAQP